MARLAGEIGDGVIVNVVHTMTWLRSVVLPALAEGEANAGRRVVRAVMLRTAVHDGSAAGRRQAVAEARASLALYQPIPYFRDIAEAEGLNPDRLDDELASRFVAIGTVAELEARLAEYAAFTDLVLLTPASNLDSQRARETYQALLTVVARWASGPRDGEPPATRLGGAAGRR